jgi:hypothetical protein
MPPLRLVYCCPAYGYHLDVGHQPMLLSLGFNLAASEERFELVMNAAVHICPVDRARNTFMHDAIGLDADWLLMVDADVSIPDGGSLLQMVSDADRRGGAAVLAPVPSRNEKRPHLMVFRDFTALQPEQFNEQLIEIHEGATACCAVNVNWIREHWPVGSEPWPWFRFTYGKGVDPTDVLGEDHGFFREVRRRGGLILCDGRVHADHVASRRLVGEPIKPSAVE